MPNFQLDSFQFSYQSCFTRTICSRPIPLQQDYHSKQRWAFRMAATWAKKRCCPEDHSVFN